MHLVRIWLSSAGSAQLPRPVMLNFYLHCTTAANSRLWVHPIIDLRSGRGQSSAHLGCITG